MDPSEFLFLILPLASLVAVLVAVVIYLAKKEHPIKHRELETLNELMRGGELDKENVSRVLEGLVTKKVIDEKSRERLRKLLEKSL
jgi:Glu-tRNA(Gln) amidotransferase subunit E-like FAD-binding protein